MTKIKIISFNFDPSTGRVEMYINKGLKNFDLLTQVDILSDIFCEFGTIQHMFAETYHRFMSEEDELVDHET